MTGYLKKIEEEWVVEHDNEGDKRVYPLCPETKKWIEKRSTKNFLKEGVEVVFGFLIKGEYCETKEMITKNYFAKIKRIEHESL